MPEFRAYIIDDDGDITLRIDLPDCADESAAREIAKTMLDGHDVELWDRANFIERFRYQDVEV
jgi:hypothetical protein